MLSADGRPMKKYLLSIIIPTKDRPETTIECVHLALQVGTAADVQVVVQDCSTTDLLNDLLHQHQLLDCVSYEKTSPVSMVQNWNRAVLRADGEYILIIGDDDAVYPTALNVAAWAKKNSFLAVKQKHYDKYWWPGFYDKNLESMALFTQQPMGDFQTEQCRPLLERFSKVGDGYSKFPMAYHNLVHYSVFDFLLSETGVFFDSLSPDVYSGYAIGSLLESFIIIDLPFTILGASPKSNSQRSRVGMGHLHANEFSDYEYSPLAPCTWGLYGSMSDSMLKAFENLHRVELLSFVDFPRIYARTIFAEPHNAIGHVRRYSQLKNYKGKAISSGYVSLGLNLFGKAFIVVLRHLKNLKKPELHFEKYTEHGSITDAVSVRMAQIDHLLVKYPVPSPAAQAGGDHEALERPGQLNHYCH